MKIRYFIAVASFAAMASNSAQAADIVRSDSTSITPASVSAPAFNWQGFYAGGQIGGSWARTSLRAWDAVGRSGVVTAKPDGFIGGLYTGYNFDIGNNIILGAETDFVWGNVKGKGFGRGELHVKQKWVGSTRLRAGYAMDRFLPYIATGVVYSRINRFAKVQGDYRDNKTRIGWTVGAGVDYAMTDNILLRVEYRYTDFGRKTSYFDIGNEHINSRMKYHANDFRVGVAYKF